MFFFSQEILEDRDIIKVGVAPYTDAKYLKDDYGEHVRSTLDLRFVAEKGRCTAGKLATMSEDYLGISLDKNSIQCSDWETNTLSKTQIEYAAQDVQVAIDLFKYFIGRIEPDKNLRYIINTHLSPYIDVNYGPHRQTRYEVKKNSIIFQTHFVLFKISIICQNIKNKIEF